MIEDDDDKELEKFIEEQDEQIIEMLNYEALELEIKEKQKFRFHYGPAYKEGYSKHNNPLNDFYNRKINIFRLTGLQLFIWSGPIVYICWKFTKNLINHKYKISSYIGKSSQGLARPLGNDHHKKDVIKNADEIEILPCLSNEDATKLERELIKFLRPLYNHNVKNLELGPREIRIHKKY